MCRTQIKDAGKGPPARALPAFVSMPLGCFLYGGVNGTRVPHCDLWHLEVHHRSHSSVHGGKQRPGITFKWHACKSLPMCPLEHAMAPGENAPSRSMLTSDRAAVGHDGPAFALACDTYLVVRTATSGV